MQFQKISPIFFGFLYPHLCSGCGREIRHPENRICLHCQHDLSYFQTVSTLENPITQLFWGKVDLNDASACFNYIKGEKLQQLIHQFKYKGQRNHSTFFGEILAQKIPQLLNYESIDFLCPIPSTRKKTKKRGYNQAEELCKACSQITGIPYLNLLIKRREKGSQTTKNVHDRHQELANSFALNPSNKLDLTGKHILLIDDVITSGATFCACAMRLRTAYNVKISLLALAYRNI